ncbi:MAG: ATP-binding protein [Patescibacteria group bacterium]
MNLFGITSLMIFFSSIGLALSLYSGNTKSRVNQAWLIASIAIALWGLSLYGVTSSLTENVAFRWQYLLDVSAIFIPVLYFNFISILTGEKNRRMRQISWGLATCLAIFSFSPLFKTGVISRYGTFWINPGQYYDVFPIFFSMYTVLALFVLIRSYRRSNDHLFRAQIRNTLIAGMIGFGGGITNFFPQLFNVYPFGNYFVLLYTLFMSYGVLKYKLMSAKIISAQLFSGALVLVFLFNLLQPSGLSDWIIKFLLFGLVLSFSILLVKDMYKEVATRERIESLAKDLAKANDRLKELDGLKSEFLSIASHQIRAPITAIKGYASLIMEENFGKVSPELRSAVEVIFESSKSMAIMVDDFLNISRIEQGRMKYDLTVTDLSALATQVVDELKPTVEKKGLTISLTFDKKANYDARIDAGKIKQAVTNLVDNAVKYTPKGSISVNLARSGGKIDLAVKDTGMGISAENIPKLFQKFSRSKDAITTNVGGTGLGLYVVKQMVEGHEGGKVCVESPGEHKGSTFHIEVEAFEKS